MHDSKDSVLNLLIFQKQYRTTYTKHLYQSNNHYETRTKYSIFISSDIRHLKNIMFDIKLIAITKEKMVLTFALSDISAWRTGAAWANGHPYGLLASQAGAYLYYNPMYCNNSVQQHWPCGLSLFLSYFSKLVKIYLSA